MNRETGSNNVNNGIHRSDFVEMNLIHRAAVDLGFGASEGSKSLAGVLFHRSRQAAVSDDLFDV
jgi:hypothetical protein